MRPASLNAAVLRILVATMSSRPSHSCGHNLDSWVFCCRPDTRIRRQIALWRSDGLQDGKSLALTKRGFKVLQTINCYVGHGGFILRGAQPKFACASLNRTTPARGNRIPCFGLREIYVEAQCEPSYFAVQHLAPDRNCTNVAAYSRGAGNF